MLGASWHHEGVVHPQRDPPFAVVVAQIDQELTVEHQEELVGVDVRVPEVFAVHFGDPNVVVVDLGDDPRAPQVGERVEQGVEIALSGCWVGHTAVCTVRSGGHCRYHFDPKGPRVRVTQTPTLPPVPEASRSAFIPRDRPIERIVRCLFGLVLFGVGITLLIESDLGAAPWDVFHTGVSELTGISTGWVIVITGVLLLLLWIPLRERPGLGTILNATVIGIVVDIALPIIGEPDQLIVRLVMMVGGVVVVAIGSGFYIGAGLGPGPRDGLMTGLAKHSIAGRSISVRAGRTFVEVVVLVIGVVLGGAIGIGTAAFTFGIGPLVQIFLPRLTMEAAPAGEPVHGATR